MLDILSKFESFEKKIYEYVASRKETYFKSECYTKLKNRYFTLSDMIDMRTHSGKGQSKNSWKSKIVFPLVRQQFLIRKAFTKANFRNDPLITVEPTGGTSFENAMNAQDVLNLNLKNTRFRPVVWPRVIDMTSRCGVSVVYSQFANDTRRHTKTAQTHYGYERVEVSVAKKNCRNVDIHPLNYFQNPEIAEPTDSDYRGHLVRMRMDQLLGEVGKDDSSYIQTNLKKVLDNAKTGLVADKNYHHIVEQSDYNAVGLDVCKVYTHLHINDNQDDDTLYYVELVGDSIIRIQEAPFDENLVPYSVFRFDIRPEYWWGNVDTENQVPAENFMNLILSMKADNAIRNLEQFIFYNKNMFDTADLNNRHKSGGLIPINLPAGGRLSDMVYGYQGRDVSGQDVDYIVREMKEVSQRMSPQPDLSRPAAAGGLQNKTLGAAQMVQEQGNVLEADMLDNFAYRLISMGEINLVMLQQFLGDQFAIRPDIKHPQRVMNKSDILGQYSYNVESSLSKNKIGEAMRLQNVLTAIMNFKGTGDPAFASIDMTKIVRDWMRKADLPGDIDDIYPEQSSMSAPGAVPSVSLPGQELAGGAVQEFALGANPLFAGVM